MTYLWFLLLDQVAQSENEHFILLYISIIYYSPNVGLVVNLHVFEGWFFFKQLHGGLSRILS